MMENLEKHSEVFAEKVIMHLVESGIGRQEAHEIVRKIAMKDGDFKENLINDERIREAVKNKIDEIFNPWSYLGAKDEIIGNIIRRWKELNELPY